MSAISSDAAADASVDGAGLISGLLFGAHADANADADADANADADASTDAVTDISARRTIAETRGANYLLTMRHRFSSVCSRISCALCIRSSGNLMGPIDPSPTLGDSNSGPSEVTRR